MQFPLPSPLLVRIAATSDEPLGIALCPDFEANQWRYGSLASHILDWLPEVALTPKERQATFHEPAKQLGRAAQRFFDVKDPSKRGEIGEVLLHAACRQEFNSYPLIARLFFKMRSNDSVTGVDVAHVVFHAEEGELELWLGEAKLYKDLNDAKSAALKSVLPMLEIGHLRELKALIGPKIDGDFKLTEKLEWLFSEEASLDQIVDRLVIPICIACDHQATVDSKKRDDPYLKGIEENLREIRDYFKNRVPANTDFVCIFIPMDSKSKLEQRVNEKIQALLK